MEGKRYAIGIQAEGKDSMGRKTVCEILEANGETLRWRTTYKETGEVFESLWSHQNPVEETRNGGPVRKALTRVNGIESDRYHDLDHCLCAVLAKLYGEEFTGYEHNYRFENGYAIDEDR